MSYLELCKYAVLIDYIEHKSGWFIEVWEHNQFLFECHWLTNSVSKLPNTIVRKLIDGHSSLPTSFKYLNNAN